jgi:hypothetical protein
MGLLKLPQSDEPREINSLVQKFSVYLLFILQHSK